MKKTLLTIAVLAILLVALGAAGVAYAQNKNSSTGSGYGHGMMGGQGSCGGTCAGNSEVGEGLLHDYMITAFSQKLEIPVADLQARLDNGETMAEIALSTGLTLEQFQTLKAEVRLQAIDQAVLDGKLTQEQADWMKQHGGQMGGRMGNGRGMHGNGQGRYANGDCPFDDDDTETTP